MKKRVLALLLAGAAVASLAACGSSDSGASGSGSAAGGDGEVVELVMGNVTSSSAKDAVTEVLIPKVEEYSNGTLKIVHFPDNQLGNDEQSFAMAQTGECDIAVGSTSSVATTYNDLYVYDVPYLFLNKQEVYDVGFNGETGKAILDGFSEYGLKGLAFWENGFRNITTTDKDIATVADLSGLKIRTMANEIHLEAWKAMGANPTPMAFGELFTGLQQGTVDGQENPLGIITGNKFEEVQSYCTLTEHVYTPYYVVMNQAKWDSLTAEQQEALTKAIEETTQRQYELSQQYEDEAIEVMEGAGCAVRTLTDEEKLGFKEAADKANSLEAAKKIMYKPELAEHMPAELHAYPNNKSQKNHAWGPPGGDPAQKLQERAEEEVVLKKILKWLDDNIELYICVFLMSFMTLLVFVQVVMRYVFNNSLSWSEELARYTFIWLIYIGISYGCKLRKHIKIDAALYLFPKKARPYVVLLGDILFIAFAVYITYTGFFYSMEQIRFDMRSAALKIPYQYIYMSTVVGFGLATIREIQTIIYRVKCLKNGEEYDG